MHTLNVPPSEYLVLCRDTEGHLHAITTKGSTWFIVDREDLKQCHLTARQAKSVMRFIDTAKPEFWQRQRGTLHNGVAGLAPLVRNSVFVRVVSVNYLPIHFSFTKNPNHGS